MLRRAIVVAFVFLFPILGCKSNFNERQTSAQNSSGLAAESETLPTVPTPANVQTSEPTRSKGPSLPADLVKYVGEPPGDLMNVPVVTDRMKALLGKRYSAFWEYMAIQNSVEQKGDFLYATGCAEQLCTIIETAIAIDIGNNRIHAMIFQSGEPVEFFNENGAATPQILSDRAKELGGEERSAVTGKCLLVVDGKTYLSGQCKITIENDGSFQITNLGEKITYFAQVQIIEKDALGYWNEEKGANHAHTPLGDLSREGACWINRRAKVCAWR